MVSKDEIRQLPLQEKLALMEFLWAELTKDPAQVEVPQWHRDLLDSREEALKRGAVEVLDWEEAKKRLQERKR